MLYLLAIVSPPFALLFAKKWGQCVLSSILMFLSLIGLFFLVIPGLILWIIAAIHAVLVIHGKKADERTQKVVDAVSAQKGTT